MSDADPAQDAAAYCAAMVRSADFGRYATTLFVPPKQRRALLALYAFDLEIARVRDHITQPLSGEIRLQWWSDTLGNAADSGGQGSPVASELLHAIGRYRLPVELFVRLVEGHSFDLYDDPMQTTADLHKYLMDTVAPLFDLAARIAGENSPDADLVRDAGLAFGLVRVIESVGLNASRRQLVLPVDLIDQFGVDTEDIFSGRTTAQLRLLLLNLDRDARRHLESAFAGLRRHQPGRHAFLPLTLIEAKLRRVEQPSYDPFKPPAPRSNFIVLWRLWRASRNAPFKA